MTKIIIFLRSLLWCIVHLPLYQAIKVPVVISCNVRCVKCKRGSIIIKNENVHRFQIQIGFGGSRCFPANRGCITISPGAHVVFYGKARFSEGIIIRAERSSQIFIGDNFYCNKNCIFRSVSSINFGQDVLCGWDIIINDTDGHTMIKDGHKQINTQSIIIDKHVWVASHCRIGKGVEIAANSVVAQGTVLVKKYNIPGSLIAGVPGRIIKSNINWEA